MLSIGLMSGTSMDGIDAALLETDGTPDNLKELGQFSIDYHPDFKCLLKSAEYAVRASFGNLKQANHDYLSYLHDYLQNALSLSFQDLATRIEQLTRYLGVEFINLEAIISHSTQLHAKAIQGLLSVTGCQASDITVVGYHGQALFHRPEEKLTIVMGYPQVLANQFGVRVVYDFRAQDVEKGGQGAPFAPLYHQALAVRDQQIPAVIVNCGGIANLTVISSAAEEELIAFDTGPGNALIDSLIRARTQGREHMDENGKWGQEGQVHEELLKILYQKAVFKQGENYFDKQPPKSLDYGDMTLIPELAALSLEDACATLETFTADSIIRSLSWVKQTIPKNWILAGGGWKNPVIRQKLEQGLKQQLGSGVHVRLAEEVAWNSQALEAQIFAYLAVRALEGRPLSYPGTTGVSQAISGGKIFYPAN